MILQVCVCVCARVCPRSCEAHKILDWMRPCIFFFFLKWMFLYHFHRCKIQTSSFTLISFLFFKSLNSLFRFPSSLIGQVRSFQQSSKVIIVIYVGRIRDEAWQKIYLKGLLIFFFFSEGGVYFICCSKICMCSICDKGGKNHQFFHMFI